MELSPAQRSYAMASFVVVPAVANTVINGAVGWLTFGAVERIPMWGLDTAIGPDLLGTCLFLPLITCLIVTALTRKHVRQGTVDPLVGSDVPDWAGFAPRGALGRGLLLGLVSIVAAGGGTLAVLWIVDVGAMDLAPLLVLKVLFAVALGLVVTPIIGILALADPVGEPAPA
jgi:hypothetical protein